MRKKIRYCSTLSRKSLLSESIEFTTPRTTCSRVFRSKNTIQTKKVAIVSSIVDLNNLRINYSSMLRTSSDRRGKSLIWWIFLRAATHSLRNRNKRIKDKMKINLMNKNLNFTKIRVRDKTLSSWLITALNWMMLKVYLAVALKVK